MISCLLLISISGVFGQDSLKRADSVTFSLTGKYALLLMSLGFEIPFDNYSVVGSVNYNYLFGTHFYAGGDIDRNVMLELRSYFKNNNSPESKKWFISVFSKYRKIDFAAPEGGEYQNDWYSGNEINLGILSGAKQYLSPKIYLEAFYGIYYGWRDGLTRTDPLDPNSSDLPTFENSKTNTIGIVLNGTLGFHLFLKKQ